MGPSGPSQPLRCRSVPPRPPVAPAPPLPRQREREVEGREGGHQCGGGREDTSAREEGDVGVVDNEDKEEASAACPGDGLDIMQQGGGEDLSPLQIVEAQPPRRRGLSYRLKDDIKYDECG